MTTTPASGLGGPATMDTCPWCGTDIEYHSNCDGPRDEWPPNEDARVWLTCPNEDCPVQPSTLVCKTLEEADVAWNTRRPAPASADWEKQARMMAIVADRHKAHAALLDAIIATLRPTAENVARLYEKVKDTQSQVWRLLRVIDGEIRDHLGLEREEDT